MFSDIVFDVPNVLFMFNLLSQTCFAHYICCPNCVLHVVFEVPIFYKFDFLCLLCFTYSILLSKWCLPIRCAVPIVYTLLFAVPIVFYVCTTPALHVLCTCVHLLRTLTRRCVCSCLVLRGQLSSNKGFRRVTP